jgi:hypothetical protein
MDMVLMVVLVPLLLLLLLLLLSMTLLDRTRHLARVVHIVVPDSIVARQSQPLALDGRRSLDRGNLER